MVSHSRYAAPRIKGARCLRPERHPRPHLSSQARLMRLADQSAAPHSELMPVDPTMLLAFEMGRQESTTRELPASLAARAARARLVNEIDPPIEWTTNLRLSPSVRGRGQTRRSRAPEPTTPRSCHEQRSTPSTRLAQRLPSPSSSYGIKRPALTGYQLTRFFASDMATTLLGNAIESIRLGVEDSRGSRSPKSRACAGRWTPKSRPSARGRSAGSIRTCGSTSTIPTILPIAALLAAPSWAIDRAS